MEATGSSETSVSYRNTTWRHYAVEFDLNLYRCDMIKCRSGDYTDRLSEIQLLKEEAVCVLNLGT
jgi:hypothetical protein